LIIVLKNTHLLETSNTYLTFSCR